MLELCCPCCFDEVSEESQTLIPRDNRRDVEQPQEYRPPGNLERQWFVESCLQQGATRKNVRLDANYLSPWGGEIDFNDPIYNWRVTNIKPGAQLYKKHVTENYIFLSILSLAPLMHPSLDEQHQWLDFKHENREAIISILTKGEPCWVKFLEIPDYNQRDCLEQLLACPKTVCQCFCPFWCPTDEDEMDIKTHVTNMRIGASRFIMDDQEQQAKSAMYWRRRCTNMSCITEFMAFVSVFCASVAAFLASAKVFGVMVSEWMVLGSGMSGTLSLALYRMSAYCRNQANEYTEDVNSFVSRNRLTEYGVTHYDKTAEATQPPPT